MKNMLAFALAAALVAPVWAAEGNADDDENVDVNEVLEDVAAQNAPRKNVAMWPAFFAIGELPVTPDLVGVRITIPFSTRQENVTGFDFGVWGRSLYFEGIQVNLLRNDVKDAAAGFQIGCYNSVIRDDMLGAQVGLWNEAGAFRGVQCGVINVCGAGQGLQIGLINRAETHYGFQVGVVNIIRDAELQFCPFVNIGF